MVNCGQMVDKEKVIYEDPWMIFYHYLLVPHWSREFT